MSSVLKKFLAVNLAMISIVSIVYLGYNLKPYQEEEDIFVSDITKPIAFIDYVKETPLQPIEVGQEFKVNSCAILDGHIFQVTLDNGDFLNVHLTRTTSEQAVEYVINTLQESTSTSIVLERKMKDYWIVKFYVAKDGNRVSLESLLEKENFLL